MLLTALEIAQGLEHLHHPDRRMVHRDLSAANVLLVTHPGERGFRALLSDFGAAGLLGVGGQAGREGCRQGWAGRPCLVLS